MFNMMPYSRRRGDLYNYNPFRDLDKLEKEFFGSSNLGEFKTDIKDNGSEYELEADLPGFKKEDIRLDISGDELVINAERHSEYEEKDKQGNFVKCERSYGSYSRSFDISGVKQEEIKASYKDGVLKLILPKTDKALPELKHLKIE